MDRGVQGVTRSWTQLSDFHFTSLQNPIVKVEIEAWREVGVGSLQMYVDSSLHLGGIVLSESEIAQSCPTLSDPMHCSLPGSSVHGIFQARVLEWGAIALSYISPKYWILLRHGEAGECRSLQTERNKECYSR